jgi:hypothetical protein
MQISFKKISKMVVTTVVYESVFLFVHKSPEYEFDLDKFNLKNQTMN